MTHSRDDATTMGWIAEAKARGWGDTLLALLDAFEPLGVVGAQMLYVAQPAARLFGGGDMLHGIASALEQPGGIERVRAALEQDHE